MSLTHVTITGADDRTDINKLLSLAQLFPFVEFGFLLGKESLRGNEPRYPSIKWFQLLHDRTKELEIKDNKNNNKNKAFSFSIHVCDDWASDIAQGCTTIFEQDGIRQLLDKFPRIQLNFSRQILNRTLDAKRLFTLLANRPQEFVFQLPSFDQYELVREARSAGIRAFGFFDPSGGRGKGPAAWPKPPHANDVSVGYAGGLGPDNLQQTLASLHSLVAAQQSTFWIDMETKVRTNDVFDLEKVRQCLVIAKPFLISAKLQPVATVEETVEETVAAAAATAVRGCVHGVGDVGNGLEVGCQMCVCGT